MEGERRIGLLRSAARALRASGDVLDAERAAIIANMLSRRGSDVYQLESTGRMENVLTPELANRFRESFFTIDETVTVGQLMEWKRNKTRRYGFPEAPETWKDFVNALSPMERVQVMGGLHDLTSLYFTLEGRKQNDVPMEERRELSVAALKRLPLQVNDETRLRLKKRTALMLGMVSAR